MRNVPGWLVGALGVAVVAGAFFMGGRLNASDLAGTSPSVASAVVPGLQVECEPGQRAILRQTGTSQPGLAPVASVACVATGRPTFVSSSAPVRTSSVRRTSVSRPRSTKKSVAIIAGSTAAGAVVGGLVKGKKGAIIGGLVGGGAATIWDQVTRRKNAGR